MKRNENYFWVYKKLGCALIIRFNPLIIFRQKNPN